MQFPMGGGSRHFTREDARQTLLWINGIGFTYFWATVVVFFYTTIVIYIPSLYKNDPETEEYRHYLAYFILAECLVNYFLCMFTKSTFNPNKCEVIPNSTWSRCLDCDAPKPPKTHHCPACRCCILKRDHHCFLTMRCVGFYNIRYMVMYCYYSAFASAYTCYLCLEFLKLIYMSPFSWENWYHFVFPITVIEFLLGHRTVYFVLHVFIIYWAGLTFVCGLGFGTMQMILSGIGMTQQDIQQGKMPDFVNGMSGGPCGLFRRIFGPWPLLNFIVPMVCFKPEGDGIHDNAEAAAKLS